MAKENNSPYYRYKQFLIRRYGKPLQRIPLDLGMGCPHREKDGSGGCTFCPENGARARQTTGIKSVYDQMDAAVAFAKTRYKATGFMAYFQAFTNTSFDTDDIYFYDELLKRFPFDAVSIGTRPDCISPATLEYLSDLNTKTDVWIELGVQTVHNRTLSSINRGHDWEASRRAIRNLHSRGINTAAHVIIGLPGESESDFIETASRLAKEPIDAVKIHNLHVITDTPLAREYAAHRFPVMDEHEYAEALIAFLQHIPHDIPVMRISTDTPDDQLVAPKWSMKKSQFANYVTNQMIRRSLRQGDFCRPKILLHVCCGPCATHSVKQLSEKYDVTLFFSNSNIYPEKEFNARRKAAESLATECGLPLVVDDYDHKQWLSHIAGYESETEQGKRCGLCFGYSLQRAARYAEENDFYRFTTTLSISPHKKNETIFTAGRIHKSFKAINFKKNEGFKHSLQLSEELGLYRQNYCGCEFSMRGLQQTP